MSAKLKSIDLTGAVVGTTGTMDFNQFPKFNPQGMDKAHVRLMNESACGLDITFKQSGNTHFLPAGAWGTFDVETNDASIAVNVAYVLPNPPVSMLIGLYYMPGEVVPQAFTLGNSPIGIGGSVVTSGSILSNEGNPDGQEVIDIGTESNAKLIDIFNDHFIWFVEQTDTPHQVLKGQTIGNPLQIGQAGDGTEVLGLLLVDQTLTVTGAAIFSSTLEVAGDLDADSTITMPNAVYLQMEDHLGTARGVLGTDASDNTLARIAGAAAQFRVLTQAAVVVLGVDAGGLNISSKKIWDTSANNLIDWTGAGLFAKGNPGSNGSMSYQANGANTDWQMGGLSTFTGSGTGTYNHNMVRFGVSAAPNFIAPIVQVSGSATQGYDTLTSTQAHITLGAVLSFKGWCYIQ